MNEKISSLKKNNHFRYVYQKGRSIANRQFVMYAARNKTGTVRLGLSISKKVGISVVRNRVRRLVKESFRLIVKDEPLFMDGKLSPGIGIDIIVIVRAPAVGLSYAETRASIIHLLLKHGFIRQKEQAQDSPAPDSGGQ